MIYKYFIHFASFIDKWTRPSDQFVEITGATSTKDIAIKLIVNGIMLIHPLIVTAALIIITVSGIRYIIASGSEEQVEHAKKTLMYGIIGLLLTILSWSIIAIISTDVLPAITSPAQ